MSKLNDPEAMSNDPTLMARLGLVSPRTAGGPQNTIPHDQSTTMDMMSNIMDR